jgi:type II secretory pathway component PulM
VKAAEKISAYWQSRQPRERRALAGLAVVLLVAALGQLLWSAQSDREKLRGQLPRLTAGLEQLKAGAEEWRNLSALPERQIAVPEEGLRREIVAGAQALGLAAAWRDTASLQMNGQTDFDSWIKWVGQVHQDYGLQVVRAKVKAAGSGRVALEAELGPATGKGGS